MTIDDRYRAQLQSTIAALRYWIPSIGDAAVVTETDGDDYWQMSVAPHEKAACPLELVIRSDGFHDLIIAGETYEDQPTEDLDMFLPLAAAIARGDVIRRHHVSADTARALAVETIVSLDRGRAWRQRRDLVPASEQNDDRIINDQHFLPYHRI